MKSSRPRYPSQTKTSANPRQPRRRKTAWWRPPPGESAVRCRRNAV